VFDEFAVRDFRNIRPVLHAPKSQRSTAQRKVRLEIFAWAVPFEGIANLASNTPKALANSSPRGNTPKALANSSPRGNMPKAFANSSPEGNTPKAFANSSPGFERQREPWVDNFTIGI
jgi:hypothetical protein